MRLKIYKKKRRVQRERERDEQRMTIMGTFIVTLKTVKITYKKKTKKTVKIGVNAPFNSCVGIVIKFLLLGKRGCGG